MALTAHQSEAHKLFLDVLNAHDDFEEGFGTAEDIKDAEGEMDNTTLRIIRDMVDTGVILPGEWSINILENLEEAAWERYYMVD